MLVYPANAPTLDPSGVDDPFLKFRQNFAARRILGFFRKMNSTRSLAANFLSNKGPPTLEWLNANRSADTDEKVLVRLTIMYQSSATRLFLGRMCHLVNSKGLLVLSGTVPERILLKAYYIQGMPDTILPPNNFAELREEVIRAVPRFITTMHEIAVSLKEAPRGSRCLVTSDMRSSMQIAIIDYLGAYKLYSRAHEANGPDTDQRNAARQAAATQAAAAHAAKYAAYLAGVANAGN